MGCSSEALAHMEVEPYFTGLENTCFCTTVKSVLLYGSETWSLTTEQTRRLDGAYSRLLRKALDEFYSVTNVDLYRYKGRVLPRVNAVLRIRRLRFAGHCFRRLDQPVHDLLFFEADGKFRPGGQARMTYPRTLLRDTGFKSTMELSRCMANRKEWRSILRRTSGGFD